MIKIILITILISIIALIIKKEKKQSINFVFINKKTRKYHQEKCPYSKNLESITIETAIEEGYTPCKICNEENV